MGIIQVPNVSAAPYVMSGELVETLMDFRPPSGYIFATYLQRRFIPAKISTFARFMENYCHTLDGWLDKKV
jgi:DNA-binding transcriptional LysR family regulator